MTKTKALTPAEAFASEDEIEIEKSIAAVNAALLAEAAYRPRGTTLSVDVALLGAGQDVRAAVAARFEAAGWRVRPGQDAFAAKMDFTE